MKKKKRNKHIERLLRSKDNLISRKRYKMNKCLLLTELDRIIHWKIFLSSYNFNKELEVETEEEEEVEERRKTSERML